MSEHRLDAGCQVRVRLVKSVHPDVEYDAAVMGDDGTHVVVRGPWAGDEARDLGFVRFEPGDVFTEHYWRDRWYSLKEVRDDGNVRKGWYCDAARPVRVEDGLLVSEDLELDLWVSADGRTVLRLDEDEFAASGISETDPVAATQAQDALEELERLAKGGFAGIDLRVDASPGEGPPSSVVDAFGGRWPPEPLDGGEGRAWRAGDVVLKPLDRSIEELDWQADLLGRVRGDGFRVSPPSRAADGSLTAGGWYATAILVGQHEPGRWADIIRGGEAFHAAVAAKPRPAFLNERDDPWAIGDRVAWGELPVGEFADAKHVSRLASARRPLDAPDQLIHGDLTGNVLFAEGLPPAIIDLSPYWRPAPFAAAIVVADALVWEGADASLRSQVGHLDHFGQYFVRALMYRAVTDHIVRGANHLRADRDDPYLPAVDIALERCGEAGASR